MDLTNCVSPPPKPLTPIIFTTDYSESDPLTITNTPVFHGTFSKVYIDKVGNLHPHDIEGTFSRADIPGRMTFSWNPQNAFKNSIKLTVLSIFCPGLKMNVTMRSSSQFALQHVTLLVFLFLFQKTFNP